MCIFTGGGGCIFLNYGVKWLRQDDVFPGVVGLWLSCQDGAKDQDKDKGKRARRIAAGDSEGGVERHPRQPVAFLLAHLSVVNGSGS